MPTNNSANNSSSAVLTDCTIDPGASGDSFVQFDINGTGEFIIGVDDDASDAFKISAGSALGTTDTFVMTAAGERTMPLQPAFCATLNSADSNVTGAGTIYTLGSGTALTERFDQGGDFNTNGTFTAPVTGRYFFTSYVAYDTTAGAGGADNISLFIQTSNKEYRVFTLPTENTVTSFAGANGYLDLAGSVLADMDAADTCVVEIFGAGGSGDNDDLYGEATDAYTSFSGYLAC